MDKILEENVFIIAYFILSTEEKDQIILRGNNIIDHLEYIKLWTYIISCNFSEFP